MLQGAGADRGDAGQARAATGLGQDSASFSVGSSGRMMRLPAALKWLVIGASAWAAWRLPIVAGELARLRGDKAPSVQIATRPTPAVATPVKARARNSPLQGKRVPVSVDLGGRRHVEQKNKITSLA